MKKLISKLKNILGKILYSPYTPILFCVIVLIFALRGRLGVPNSEELSKLAWKDAGPFELSPERGRFALTYSLVEDLAVHFSVPLARFVTPDLGFWRGNYVSLLAPGVSFLVIPGYLIGRYFGASQVGSFAAISLFAFGNFMLIIKISRLLGAKYKAAVVAGMLFIFATPAFAYAVSLYQHHISTFLILLGIYLLIKFENKYLSLFSIWFLCATSLLVDYPNLFLMFPIGLAALLKMFEVKNTKAAVKVSLKPWILTSFLGVVVPLVIFGGFNNLSYGSPLQLAGTVPYVSRIGDDGLPITSISLEELSNVEPQSSIGFFNTRNFVNGLYTHLFSLDRGVIVFAPIVLFGVLGAYLLYKSNDNMLPPLVGIAAVNISLYSMWGDPWGGWAFGSRYLIPTYAVMAVLTSIVLTRFSRNKVFLGVFYLLMTYSIVVNSLGAVTTSANPPKIQAIPLQEVSGKIERYSWDRNWEYLNTVGSKSLVFREVAVKYVDARTYYLIIAGAIALFSLEQMRQLYIDKTNK